MKRLVLKVAMYVDVPDDVDESDVELDIKNPRQTIKFKNWATDEPIVGELYAYEIWQD